MKIFYYENILLKIVSFFLIINFLIISNVFTQERCGIIEMYYVAFLFAYFTCNDQNQEQVHYAISTDVFNYKALNKNNPILDSKIINSTSSVKDPHILRGEDGYTFYMV